MLALRSFMFERVYLGPHTAAEHERARTAVRAIFEHLVERGDGPTEIVDYVAGMTDRFALDYAAGLVMARIKDESVEAVKAAANIVELVEARVRLRKVGGRYSGLCPFHQEKTPSFSVSPDRGTYHCFGCGVGGDSISFVRETESLDFVGAIEWLAERFRVPLEYEDASPEADAKRHRRQRLYALLDQAASFYERVLWETPAGEPVREYLTSRGLREEVCHEFRLGLSPTGAKLSKGAGEKGFTREELGAAGLLSRRGGDYFERRLMFPLTDARGRIVGFQARKLHENDPLRGKYVNSPESELFRKSNVLYGLNLARAAISKEDRALVVEGEHGRDRPAAGRGPPVVASMGTALTEAQLKELGRLTRRLFLCFDSDAAGEDATLRGMELAAKQSFDVRVVALPSGKDPADDPTGFEQHLGAAESYPVHRVRLILDRTPDRQLAYLAVQEFLNGIPRVARAPRRLAACKRPPRVDRAVARDRRLGRRGCTRVVENDRRRRTPRAQSSGGLRGPSGRCAPLGRADPRTLRQRAQPAAARSPGRGKRGRRP